MPREQQDIAIIGMACLYPGAPALDRFWSNILAKVDAVTDPPATWSVEDFYDPASPDNDKTYCKKGGFIDEHAAFDPLEFGIMPGSVDGSDPEIFLALKIARDVLEDAGYATRPFDRKRTAVILGHGSYVNRGVATAFHHTVVINQILGILKNLHPTISDEDLRIIKRELKAGQPPFKADVCPGLISNLLSGMIANRLDLQGPNFVIDAACASSLIAFELGAGKLESGECDMAIVGGVQAYTSLPVFVIFSLLGALSRRGKIRPFDREADGTILGEGVGMMVIKRREDAERDGDRIYALLKGIGTSSDGKAQAALVPRLEGELLALERSYRKAAVPPRSIGLIEAHGTATKVGDVTEMRALTHQFGGRKGDFPECALGSVKSMISHTIPASGMASLIKTALSLYHKVLPPTLCNEPNPDLEMDKTPFYLNTETRPWIHGGPHPRRAGVSAFGFGGINAHAVVEEYTGSVRTNEKKFGHAWDSEVVILRAPGRAGLIDSSRKLLRFITDHRDAELKDIAYTLNCAALPESSPACLSIVASSSEDLQKKLELAAGRLADPSCTELRDGAGIFFTDRPLAGEGKLAFLFPGEGSQYVNMLAELCLHFPEVRQWFDRAERVFSRRSITPSLSQVLFPPPYCSGELRATADRTLMSMRYAVLSVCAADLALHELLRRLGIQPQALAGHSIGQDVAILISGMIREDDEEEVIDRYYERNAAVYGAPEETVPKAKLMSVGLMAPEAVYALARESKGGLFVAMDNCPNQIVLCGSDKAVQGAYDQLVNKGALCSFLPFDRGYHTPWYSPLCDRIRGGVGRFEVRPPSLALYSCTTAGLFPEDAERARTIMVDQWMLPVRFRETVEKMYDDGVRIFVEAGPRGNLTGFVEDTLRDRGCIAVPANVSSRSAIAQLNRVVGQLAAHGVRVQPDYLYHNRPVRRLAIEGLTNEAPVHPGAGPGKKRSVMKLELVAPRLALSEQVRGLLSGNNDLSPPGGEREEHSSAAGDYGLTRIFWQSPAELCASSGLLASCLCLDEGGDHTEEIADHILNEQEQRTWRDLTWPAARRREWLLGRVAAKDALRHLVNDELGILVHYEEIEIEKDEFGRPLAAGEAIGKLTGVPLLSIAHSEGMTVAVAARGSDGVKGIGIDIEQMTRGNDGLEEAGFSAAERSLLHAFRASEQAEWLLRFWCAKEAVGKAVGRGLGGTPLNVVIETVDAATGRIGARLSGHLARERPQYADRTISAGTGRDDTLVFATCVLS